MEFIVYSIKECFAIYKKGEGSEQVFCAFFDSAKWWYRGKKGTQWQHMNYFSTDFLLEAFYRLNYTEIDIKTFMELKRKMSAYCSENFPEILC